jgi:hypothetical protein
VASVASAERLTDRRRPDRHRGRQHRSAPSAWCARVSLCHPDRRVGLGSDAKETNVTRDEAFEERVREQLRRVAEDHLDMSGDPRVPDAPPASVTEPQQSDLVIREHTGRGWEQWREAIEDWPGHEQGHAAVASWLQEEHGVPGWWAQAVTVGWERITGRRQSNQMSDGTFTANRSSTIVTDHVALGAMLRDRDGLADLFPRLDPVLRSRATSKNVRVGLTSGVAEIALVPKDGGRVTVTVAHVKLGTAEEVTRWKAYWQDWLRALDEG